jgi:hypothetical protein
MRYEHLLVCVLLIGSPVMALSECVGWRGKRDDRLDNLTGCALGVAEINVHRLEQYRVRCAHEKRDKSSYRDHRHWWSRFFMQGDRGLLRSRALISTPHESLRKSYRRAVPKIEAGHL